MAITQRTDGKLFELQNWIKLVTVTEQTFSIFSREDRIIWLLFAVRPDVLQLDHYNAQIGFQSSTN